MFVIPSDFGVCQQIIKGKPERFERKPQKQDLTKRTSCDIKKLRMSAVGTRIKQLCYQVV